MDLNKEFNHTAIIKVIGVGGGGCNAVNRMVEENVQGVDFIVANTDAQVLAASSAPKKIILGKDISKGLGAGANPEIGKKAAEESKEDLKNALAGADLIFVAAGMGGGTGTGAAPEIAKIAKESGALVIGIVTKPFKFEGRLRIKFAVEGIDQLREHVDSLIIISNDRLLEIIGSIPIQDSFREADNILKQGVQTITDLIAVPAIINLDFADVRTVMKDKGNALFGIGIGTGADKAVEAANKAITSSLLETSIHGAKDAIINVTGGKGFTLNDAYDAVDIIQQASGEDVNIIFGAAVNEHLEDELIVTVIATGFDENFASTRFQEQEQQMAYEESKRNYPGTEYLAGPSGSYINNNGQLQTAQDVRTSFIQEDKRNIQYLNNGVEERFSERVSNLEEQRMNQQQQPQPGYMNQQQPQPGYMNNQEMQNNYNQPNMQMDETEEEDDFPTFLKKKW